MIPVLGIVIIVIVIFLTGWAMCEIELENNPMPAASFVTMFLDLICYLAAVYLLIPLAPALIGPIVVFGFMAAFALFIAGYAVREKIG